MITLTQKRLGFAVDGVTAALRLDQCLSEAGYPGSSIDGHLGTHDAPPRVMYTAWQMSTGSSVDFDQWRDECLRIGGRWPQYFAAHEAGYPDNTDTDSSDS